MATAYRTREGDVLDDLCWRHYGRQAGAVEAVLDANRGLGDQGAVYPAGVVIVFPDLPAPGGAGKAVKLWD